jgi:predicted lysophospholipase L1 biosynthesis ABC-type transport system permease subunit
VAVAPGAPQPLDGNAAVLALALTIVASVRQRRRELALLKSLGMRRSQLRAVVLSQATTRLVVAIVTGIPLGIAAGRWAWTAFAVASAPYLLPLRTPEEQERTD